LVLASALAWTTFTIGGKGFISRFAPYRERPRVLTRDGGLPLFQPSLPS
jgi:hypothetical protein